MEGLKVKQGYTPGPWQVEKLTARSGYSSDYSVVTMGPNINHARVYGGEHKEANASLIAAAPELLEACKKALAWIKTTSGGHTPMWIDEAIAKAEGRS